MAEEEKNIALSAEKEYGNSVKVGYPLLRDRGKLLRKQGIAFFDLTMVFENDAEILYVDNCCHLNASGYNKTAEEMVRRIQNGPESGALNSARQQQR